MEGSCFTFYLQDLVHMSLSPQGNKIEYSSSNPFNTYYSVACYVSVTLLGICVGSYQTKASVSVPSAGRGKHTLGIRAGLSRALGNVQGCRMLRTWHEGNTAVAHTGLKTSDPTCEQNAVPSPPPHPVHSCRTQSPRGSQQADSWSVMQEAGGRIQKLIQAIGKALHMNLVLQRLGSNLCLFNLISLKTYLYCFSKYHYK